MSSSQYIGLPIETDSAVLTATALDALVNAIPGYVPQEGHLEVRLIEILARMEAETRDVATRVPPSIFRYMGKSLLNLPAVDAAKASTFSTWTVKDAAGYTIEAGTLVAFAPSANKQAFFEVARDVVIPGGSTSTSVAEVELIATEAGSAANQLAVGTLALVDSLAFVTSVVSTATTAGGVDAESDIDYLDRLRTELTLLTPRPIRPEDFAVLARRIAGVDRAIAIDGYNPDNGTYNNERTVTVALADTEGQAVSSETKAAVVSYLESLREINFIVRAINPTYTVVPVSATVAKLPGVDKAQLAETIASALRVYLSPSEWDWDTIVRHNELISLIDRIPGVDYVDSVTVPTGNVILPGVAALVNAGQITISVIN